MHLFTAVLSEATLFKNCNTLLNDWQWHQDHHQNLAINQQGEIVINMSTSVPLNLTFHTPIPLEKSFAQEKLVVLWHWSKFAAFIEKRFDEVESLPAKDIPTLYAKGQIMQGILFLSQKLIAHIWMMNEAMSLHEKMNNLTLDERSFVAQLQLAQDWNAMLAQTQMLLEELAARQKLTLNRVQLVQIQMPFIDNSVEQIVVTAVPTLAPIKFEIANHTRAKVRIFAHFTQKCNYFSEHKGALFSDEITISVFQNDELMPVFLGVYPGWSDAKNNQYKPCFNMLETSCDYGPSIRICDQFEKYGTGVLFYQPTDLIVTLKGMHSEYSASNLFSHFQFMIELAQLHDYARVILYAPHMFSAKAYAMGFYSDDNEQPSLAFQQEQVEFAANRNKIVGELDEKFLQLNDCYEEILRPFYFNLDEVAVRRVHLTEKNITFTYQSMMKKVKYIEVEKHPQGILPNYYQIPTQPYYATYKQRSQRIGKLKPQKLTFNYEKLDYSRLQDEKRLQTIGELCEVSCKKSTQSDVMIPTLRKM